MNCRIDHFETFKQQKVIKFENFKMNFLNTPSTGILRNEYRAPRRVLTGAHRCGASRNTAKEGDYGADIFVYPKSIQNCRRA